MGNRMILRYATFAINGPLKNCYATVEAESEHHIRQWLRLHFPLDWAGLYHHAEFDRQARQYNLKEVFAAKLGHTNESSVS